MIPIASVQIGKKGVPENLTESLQTFFKAHQNVKLVFLKSSYRDKKKIKDVVEKVIDDLGANYTYRVVGFTVFLKKWRKAQR